MANINKYWVILESLEFPTFGALTDGSLKEQERSKSNLRVLQDFIKLTPEHIVKEIINHGNLQHLYNKHHKILEIVDGHFLYCLYFLKLVLEIVKGTNFSSSSKEDLVSEKHKSLVISGIVDVAAFGLQENLHGAFYNENCAIFKKKSESKTNFFWLEFLVDTCMPLISIRDLHVGKSLDDVNLSYMASIFSLIIANDTNDYCLEKSYIESLQKKLQKLWLENSKKLYYRNLMLLFSSLPKIHRQIIHREMLLKLWSPGGFVALLFAMAESQQSEEQPLDEIVANLVAQTNFTIKAQHSLIKQILLFLEVSVRNKDFSPLMSAGVLSLRKLYDNKKENKDLIMKWIENKMEQLVIVEMSKIVAMEWLNFIDLVSLIFHIFCTSSIATLPSNLLTPYLPLLLELHAQIKCHTNENSLSNHLRSLILKILNNRSREEFSNIIESVTLRSYPKEWFKLSNNIQIKANSLNMQELKLCVVDNETQALLEGNKYPLTSLVEMLKNSSYNLLTYQLFQILLQLVPTLIVETKSATINSSNIDLLHSEEDIYNRFLVDFSHEYENKIQILKALETLIHHQPLKTLINENIKDILATLQEILAVYIKSPHNYSFQTGEHSTVLTILIILIREIIENCSTNDENLQTNLLKDLKSLHCQSTDDNLKYQLNVLIKIINNEDAASAHVCDKSKTYFEEARSLIESNESYLQVQGVEMMIKLLNKRDPFTVTNGHMLTALGLNTLKSPESYTFLNCVRLFVALLNVNEAEVLELLSGEYLNEAAGMDYRLVIGEAILKTSIELGPLCYKYKNILLNTYMAGCRSPLDEFKFSAFSNLSQMCRQLTFQVHNYFQELLNLINCELTTGKYLPAKRAAVMVLSDLLAGMDNLFDYQDMLLPIYRILKYLVVSAETDEKIRIHASNGLKCLSEKCKELLKTGLEQNQKVTSLEKEIKIMGIHDKPRRNLKSQILEIN